MIRGIYRRSHAHTTPGATFPRTSSHATNAPPSYRTAAREQYYRHALIVKGFA
jgi:hypothetical protein